jgi:hypothetical protein
MSAMTTFAVVWRRDFQEDRQGASAPSRQGDYKPTHLALQAAPPPGDLTPSQREERSMVWHVPADAEIAALMGIDVERALAAVRGALDCGWWLVRAHVAEVHLLPRSEALGPPPAPWLEGWPAEPGPVARHRAARSGASRGLGVSPERTLPQAAPR